MYRHGHKHNPRRKFLIRAFVILWAGLLIIAILLLTHHSRPTSPSTNLRTVISSIAPSAQQISSYTVAPDLPRYISIPSLGLNQTRIIQLGLLQNNEIATPNNIYDAGWYKNSAKPGKPGAMFIYGHVSSWTANGAFYNLKRLGIGDKIIIVRGDGKIFIYQVNKIKIYQAQDVNMSEVLSPINPDKQGLNLMTCTGSVIKGTSDFSERLVVFATADD